MKLKSKRNFLILSLLIPLLLVVVALYLYLASSNKTLECYATWDSGRLVIGYLFLKNKWPQNWEDLSSVSDKIVFKGPLSLAEIKSMIDVDFNEDILKLQQKVGTAKIIELKNGHDSFWENANPNNLIMEYLKTNNKEEFIKRHNILISE